MRRGERTFRAGVAYNLGMAGLLKIAVLMNAVAMALPLGWCCPKPAPADHLTASETGACPNCRSEEAPARDQTPTAPEKCPCCQARAIVAADHVSVPAAPHVWVSLPPAIENPASAGRSRHPAEFPLLPSPDAALYVLHCVWRC